MCYGGPPTDRSTYEYTIKENQIFVRLIDLREDGIYGVNYEVVNAQVLEADIRRRKNYDSVGTHVERLKAAVLWNELSGSLRYFILYKHGCQLAFFSKERQRLQKGFETLEKEAMQLGAVRKSFRWYEASDEADEKAKKAIQRLQQDDQLKRFQISFSELIRYEHIIQTLNHLISGSEVSV